MPKKAYIPIHFSSDELKKDPVESRRWHRSQKVNTPEGVSVEYSPAYSPELQPAERLWALVEEPLVTFFIIF